jgi:hypothetical protein
MSFFSEDRIRRFVQLLAVSVADLSDGEDQVAAKGTNKGAVGTIHHCRMWPVSRLSFRVSKYSIFYT